MLSCDCDMCHINKTGIILLLCCRGSHSAVGCLLGEGVEGVGQGHHTGQWAHVFVVLLRLVILVQGEVSGEDVRINCIIGIPFSK